MSFFICKYDPFYIHIGLFSHVMTGRRADEAHEAHTHVECFFSYVHVSPFIDLFSYLYETLSVFI